LRRHLLLGPVTGALLAVAWLVLDFLFTQLSRLGALAVAGLARTVRPWYEPLAPWLRKG
jgi:L-aminopeptidase/D-esterase-like protein